MRPITAKAFGLGMLLGIPAVVAGSDMVDASPVPCDVPDLASAIAGTGPVILGETELGYDELTAWWASTGRGQPANLGLPVNDVIGIYLEEAAAEGVRGDFAVAQAIHETGWFTNSDTAIHNFAGIGHYDDAPSGFAYPDVRTGVRAHIQLLKRFAAGNDASLSNPVVAPTAGAHTTTWPGLAGTWASDPVYWSKLASMYAQMLQPSFKDSCQVEDPTNSGAESVTVTDVVVPPPEA